MGDLPVWAWVLIAVAIPLAFLAWKYLGLRAAGVVALIGGAAAALARAKQSGYNKGVSDAENAANKRADETRERIGDAVERSHAGGGAWHDRLRNSKPK